MFAWHVVELGSTIDFNFDRFEFVAAKKCLHNF